MREAVCVYRSDEDEILTGLITAHEHRPHPVVLDGGRCSWPAARRAGATLRTRQRSQGQERQRRSKGPRSFSDEGEGTDELASEFPKACRLCRPPKRSEVPRPLMPFSGPWSIGRVSDRSMAASLVFQGIAGV